MLAPDHQTLPEGRLVEGLTHPEGIVMQQTAVHHQLHVPSLQGGPTLVETKLFKFQTETTQAHLALNKFN